MRTIIQRVSKASVSVNGNLTGAINQGIVILLGIENGDGSEDIHWLVNKLIQLRIFSDANNKMNLSIEDVKGEFLVISQFTLYASTKKGNRPSYLKSAKPEIAIPLYEEFLKRLSSQTSQKIETGVFGADMQVNLINDGPVTIFIDTKLKE